MIAATWETEAGTHILKLSWGHTVRSCLKIKIIVGRKKEAGDGGYHSPGAELFPNKHEILRSTSNITEE